MVYNVWYEVERTWLDIISVNIVESHRRDKKQVEVL